MRNAQKKKWCLTSYVSRITHYVLLPTPPVSPYLQHFGAAALLNERYVGFEFFLYYRISEINRLLTLRRHVGCHTKLGDLEAIAQRQKAVAPGEKGTGRFFIFVGVAVQIRFIVLHREQAARSRGFLERRLGIGNGFGRGI